MCLEFAFQLVPTILCLILAAHAVFCKALFLCTIIFSVFQLMPILCSLVIIIVFYFQLAIHAVVFLS